MASGNMMVPKPGKNDYGKKSKGTKPSTPKK